MEENNLITISQLLIIVSGPIAELSPDEDPLPPVRAAIWACKFFTSDCSASETTTTCFKI